MSRHRTPEFDAHIHEVAGQGMPPGKIVDIRPKRDRSWWKTRDGWMEAALTLFGAVLVIVLVLWITGVAIRIVAVP